MRTGMSKDHYLSNSCAVFGVPSCHWLSNAFMYDGCDGVHIDCQANCNSQKGAVTIESDASDCEVTIEM